jgi:hypothetical protein
LAWTVGKNTARGKNSKLQEIDLPIRSTNQSETLGVDGVPRGLPLAKSLAQNPLNQEELEVSPQEHLPMETTENIQIGSISEGLLDQGHQAKRHKVLIRNIQQESLEEMPPKSSPWKIQENTPKITKKEKREQHIQAWRNHSESSIHTKEVHTRSSLPPDHPSLSQDLTIKLSS